jgi:large subunit ribosomal protein L22
MMPGLKTNEREGTRAVLRHARLSASKVREVLDLIRGKPVHEAEDILRFSERDAAFVVGKVLHSAIANAENNDEMDAEELYVSACFADEGTTMKRWRPRARGRATRIRKRTSHITVIVSRMPDLQLQRLQQRRRAEQLAQRARRVAGARRAEGDTRSRSDRRRGVTWDDLEETASAETAETGDASAVGTASGDQPPADSIADSAEDTDVGDTDAGDAELEEAGADAEPTDADEEAAEAEAPDEAEIDAVAGEEPADEKDED